MNCPFCGTELEKEMAGDIETGRLVCCTKNCPVIDQNLFPDVWELLTAGKEAQEVLKKIANHDINEQRGEPKSYVIGYEEIKEMAITSLTKS